MELKDLDQMTRLQLEGVAAAYKPAAEKLEGFAALIRQMDGVQSATVHCPDADDLAFDWPDAIQSPSMTVECFRGHSASDLDSKFSIKRIGDGSGQFGPLWVYAL